MHELLRSLKAGRRVLDLGCAEGSFAPESTAAAVIRLDRERPGKTTSGASFVQADAAGLPFPDGSFHAVISNHSLEHFDKPKAALREIARVLSADGALFIAVPDASTFTDRVYRWLARGGGHVNAFTSPETTAAFIADATGLPHVGTRTLWSSLSFLNRRNAPRPLPRRLLLVGGGTEWSLFLYGWLSRRIDRLFRTNTGIYGWAFYFGRIEGVVDAVSWPNVCLRCGAGASAVSLRQRDAVRKAFGLVTVYRCPSCNTTNPFIEDRTVKK